MWKKYVPYISSVVFFASALLGITLLLAFVYGVIIGVLGGADLFRSQFFFRAAADALFFEGGIVLTFGALIEFLFKARSPIVARGMMSPFDVLSRQYAIIAMCKNASDEEGRSGGWMLIFSGALLVIFSLAFALISMK